MATVILLLAACLPSYAPPEGTTDQGCIQSEEVCDQRDNDCDGVVDEDLAIAQGFRDADGDGLVGREFSTWTCVDESDWPALGLSPPPDPTECDDTDPALPAERFVDLDGDGWGTDSVWTCSEQELEDWPASATDFPDCDDTDPDVHPKATEICGDGKVNECVDEEGVTPEMLADQAAAGCREEGLRASEVQVGTIPGNNMLEMLDLDGDGRQDAFGGASAMQYVPTDEWFVLWGGPDVTGADATPQGFPLGLANLQGVDFQVSATDFLAQDADQLLIGGTGTLWVMVGLFPQWQLTTSDYVALHATHIGPRDPGGSDQIAVWQEGGAVWLLGPETFLGQPRGIALDAADAEPDALGSGVTLETAGDMDGDGIAELLLLDHDNDAVETDGAAAWTWQAPGDTQWTGAVAGDLNGDGFGDVVVGSTEPLDACDTGGAVLVALGQAGAPVHVVVQAAHISFASDLAGGQDLDRDGHQDVIVAAATNDNTNGLNPALYVLWGDPNWAVPGFRSPCDHVEVAVDGISGSELGRQVGVGDVDGDGVSEVIGLATGSSGQTLQVFHMGGY